MNNERAQYELHPLVLVGHYHPLVLPSYLALLGAAGFIFIFMRRRTYRGLEREAVQAVQTRGRSMAPVLATQPALLEAPEQGRQAAAEVEPQPKAGLLIRLGRACGLGRLGSATAPMAEAPPDWFTRLESRWRNSVGTPSAPGRLGWWQHLGLPLLYRHTPAAGTVRSGLLGVAILCILFLGGRVLLFPPDPLNFLDRLQRTLGLQNLFGLYESEWHGCLALFSFTITMAALLSTVLAPLYATYSLSQERESGTLDFLRLAPFSTPGIVLGKLFGSTWLLHLCSASILVLALPFGYKAGVPPLQIVLVVLSVVLSGLFLHAAGGYLTTLPFTLKGFAPVFGLGVLQFVSAGISLGMVRNRGTSFLCYLSPWGAWEMVSESWPHWPAGYSDWQHQYHPFESAVFFGRESLILVAQALTLITAASALLWAAIRKFEDPGQPALPRPMWLGLWLAGLILAVGTACNPVAGQFGGQGAAWANALKILLGSCGIVSALAFCDHPFSRERVVSRGGRPDEGRSGSGAWWLKHWVFAASLALVTALVILEFGWVRDGYQVSVGPEIGEASGHSMVSLAALGLIIVAGTWVGSVFLEAMAIRISLLTARTFAPPLALAVWMVLALVPAAHVESVAKDWQTWMRGRKELPRLEASLSKLTSALSAYPKPSNAPGAKAEYEKSMKLQRQIQQWTDRMDAVQLSHGFEAPDAAAAGAVGPAERGNPLLLMLGYHPFISLGYGAVWLLCGMGAPWLRRRSYAALAREIQKAGRAVSGPLKVGKPVKAIAEVVKS